MSIELKLQSYIDELIAINSECMRPARDGQQCSQCKERDLVIRKLQAILR